MAKKSSTRPPVDATDPDVKFLMELFEEDLQKRILWELSKEKDPDLVVRRLLAVLENV